MEYFKDLDERQARQFAAIIAERNGRKSTLSKHPEYITIFREIVALDVAGLPQDADTKWLRLTPSQIQQIFSGCKVTPDANIYIGTYQSLCKECAEFFSQFDMVLTDEVHLACSASQIKIMDMCKFPYRIGLSGTIPVTKYADGLTLVSNFGPVLVDIKAKQLQEEGYISNCKITQVRLDYTSDKQKDAFKEAKKSLVKIGKGKDMYQLENKFVNESERRFYIIS